ncbi:MAG: class I SAM-dependent methyltransferase, partial [Tardiphaga sp.]
MNKPFFETHDRFLRSSSVGNWPDRLNLRYEAIIDRTAGQLRGARVLDIASHDGRWSFAALEAGAAHVTGIEVRPELSAAAKINIASDRFNAVTGDVFTQRAIFDQPFDVVLCLGFLYHTTRHEEIFELIRATHARTVVVDTRLTPGDGNFVQIHKERADDPAHGLADRGVRDEMILYGWPTRGAVTFMLDHF